ncbi:hypothetical protein KQ940_22235 [Marinobacterium sp. D7]|uniref:hypothetical protein n=1 Tax=Marinobacterium ramblicola TaxID=2849041 RepID=UPI001C2D4441|nr:hypothetical protein [Marinobacterium ramblicola]MBV1790790.1 hypothetical protein [Marinobacterium ramblicola]
MTEHELNEGIKRFATSISQQQLGLAIYRPVPSALHSMCIENAKKISELKGGSIRYGWYFFHKISPAYGDYLVATHHAVWHNPDTLLLVDVTPFHPDKNHHPIAPGGDVLFLVDDKAKPFEKEQKIIPRPSLFYALGVNDELLEYVTKLQMDEYEYYSRTFGIEISA